MTIGILGGGQLGRMLALAGYPMGHQFRFYDPSADACAGHVGHLVVGNWDDRELLSKFADGCDVITYEWENVPLDVIRHVQSITHVHPSIRALETSQDRLKEKTLFRELHIPVADFVEVNSAQEALSAVQRLGCPAILKTRRMGYDGKGQAVLKDSSAALDAYEQIGAVASILEKWVDYDRELSLIAACTPSDLNCYRLVENHHSEAILDYTLAPAPNVNNNLQELAELYAQRIAAKLEYVGVFAIEFFQIGDSLLANEMAPRVHNSGHWTIEGAVTSQFENHIRCILNEPIGPTENRFRCKMKNVVGIPTDEQKKEMREKTANKFSHDYGKEPRPRRKIGHITTIEPLES